MVEWHFSLPVSDVWRRTRKTASSTRVETDFRHWWLMWYSKAPLNTIVRHDSRSSTKPPTQRVSAIDGKGQTTLVSSYHVGLSQRGALFFCIDTIASSCKSLFHEKDMKREEVK
jgi:hypothetical protein